MYLFGAVDEEASSRADTAFGSVNRKSRQTIGATCRDGAGIQSGILRK